ncbi:MAG TPA: hypothetical protein VIL49_10590 [Capillimicrobium sp.]
MSAGAASAATAFFPGVPPATQITQDLTLQQAAQQGLIKLQAKGGGQGDAVSLELEGKRVRAPITVTLRVEMTSKDRLSPAEREALRDLVPYIQSQTEAELNHVPYTTRNGDPVRFTLDYRWREPEEAPRGNYHQVLIVDPLRDLPEPDKDFRSEVEGLVAPNSFETTTGTFSTTDLRPVVLAHESMHLAGLDDRYADFYRVGGKDWPMPEQGMSPSAVRNFARTHQPRLPSPPAGEVIAKNIPKTEACDMMGTGAYDACRKLSQRDIDWFAAQSGVQVTAQPGDLLLNKSPDKQNLGVGFQTIVFATPGSTTVANGISVYCLDHDRAFPLDESFDVGPAASEMPGYGGVLALLQLNARIATSLDDTTNAMQAALWNLTDAAPLATSGSADEARALMAEAGATENSVPGGLPAIANPNAGSVDTGAVDASGAVAPTIPAEPATEPPLVRIAAAQLFPARLRASRATRADLLISTVGDVSQLTLRVERRVRRSWKEVRTLPGGAPPEAGQTTRSLNLGRLGRGRYRLMVTAAGTSGAPAVAPVAFRVR